MPKQQIAQHLYRAKCSFFPNCRQILCITIFELLGTSSQSSLFNVPLYQISVNLENFSFWDQIFPKKTLGWSIKINSTWEYLTLRKRYYNMAGFRWFQVVSHNLWVVSDGFRWFQVVSCGFKSFLVLVSIRFLMFCIITSELTFS